MRIAFFVWEYPPAIVGGLGTYAQYITREFLALGWDVCVYTLNPGNLARALTAIIGCAILSLAIILSLRKTL